MRGSHDGPIIERNPRCDELHVGVRPLLFREIHLAWNLILQICIQAASARRQNVTDDPPPERWCWTNATSHMPAQVMLVCVSGNFIRFRGFTIRWLQKRGLNKALSMSWCKMTTPYPGSNQRWTYSSNFIGHYQLLTYSYNYITSSWTHTLYNNFKQ